MRKEAATSHLQRGIMLWQKVDRQFRVPLEDGRSFRVDVSASKLIQCTCVCHVSPHICFVHSGPAPRCMIHRVVPDDRALMCEHGILHTSTHPCQHRHCKNNRALLQEHLDESICFPDPSTHPTGEQEEVVILTATACGSSSSSTPTRPPCPDCPVCAYPLVGPPSCGRGMFNPPSGAWGKTSCCGNDVHSACLSRWLRMCVNSAERRCMFCRAVLSGSSSRSWRQPLS
jgi:hypothetical protein